VDQVDLRSVADRVAEFHASIWGEEFEELRVACRRLWEEWLSPEAFLANFHHHLEVMDLPGRSGQRLPPQHPYTCAFASPLRKAGATVRLLSTRWDGMPTARAEGGPVDRE
jgi:hypothetical protein